MVEIVRYKEKHNEEKEEEIGDEGNLLQQWRQQDVFEETDLAFVEKNLVLNHENLKGGV